MPDDFKICALEGGDTALQPMSLKARDHVLESIRLHGAESVLPGKGLFVETSRSEQYLTDTVSDLTRLGFTVA